MSELFESIGRLEAWIRNFGHLKERPFIADLQAVIDGYKSESELFDGLGAMNHRLFLALKSIERASSLDEAKRLAKAAREAEGLLS